MSRKAGLLHVRSYIEWVVKSAEMINEMEKKSPGTIPPIIIDDLNKQKLIGKAILRRHKEKGTRKDIYVET